MVSARVKVLITGIAIIIVFLVLYFALNSLFGINLASGIPYVLISGILLIISSFLPSALATVFRNITYLLLFIFILIIELQLFQPFIQASQINITQCKSLFFPPVEENVSNITINALGITSCILTGYFPQHQSILGWSTFLIFYIILPFAFIFALVIGLMKNIFKRSTGEQLLDDKILNVLSFIIAMYATRVMFGGFLLQFLGYSTWGLAGVFGAIFIVGGLKNLIEQWFDIETYAQQIKNYYETQKTERQKYAEQALKIVNELKNSLSKVKLSGTEADKVIKDAIQADVNKLKNIPFFNALTRDEQEIINRILNEIGVEVEGGELGKAKVALDQLEKVLKIWK